MSAQVLYVDTCSHTVPLQLCYHVTGSQLACSAPHSAPPCTSNTEIESGYCPQCLAFWDAAAVASHRGKCTPSNNNEHGTDNAESSTRDEQYLNIGGGCKACPICSCKLVISTIPDYSSRERTMICVWSCGYCRWDSTECSLSVNLLTEDCGGVGATIRSLQAQLGMRTVEDRKGREDIFHALQLEYRQQYLDQVKNKQQRDVLATHGLILKSNKDNGPGEEDKNRVRKNISDLIHRPTWSLEALEQSLEKKKHDWNTQGTTQAIWDTLWHFQGPQPTTDIATSPLLPVPVQLLPRTIRRCRTELAAGRPGILVMPKGNPMDGDSSFRFGHGKWWKKVRLPCMPQYGFDGTVELLTQQHYLCRIHLLFIPFQRLRYSVMERMIRPTDNIMHSYYLLQTLHLKRCNCHSTLIEV